jgi:hypothetical protein
MTAIYIRLKLLSSLSWPQIKEYQGISRKMTISRKMRAKKEEGSNNA